MAKRAKLRGKKRKRFRWLNRMKHRLLAVVLGGEHRDTGHRVVRVVRALYDRKEKQVVRVVVRAFGGPPVKAARYGGFAGRIYDLTDRRFFVNGRGQTARGVPYGGGNPWEIDAFVRALYKGQVPDDAARVRVAGGGRTKKPAAAGPVKPAEPPPTLIAANKPPPAPPAPPPPKPQPVKPPAVKPPVQKKPAARPPKAPRRRPPPASFWDD